MARQTNRLTVVEINKLTQSGLYGDGLGLYLQITKTGGKSWLFRYMRHGKARAVGLGSLNLVPLREARAKALECRKQLLEGNDVIGRGRARRANETSVVQIMTFKRCAEAYIAAHAAGWKSAKHAEQWRSTLSTYAEPVIGEMPVGDVDTARVMMVLEPIWRTKTETASRVRGRIESVLDWATVRQFRNGENPARWKGHLDHLLPKRSKVQRVVHHPALAHTDGPPFFQTLRLQDGSAARALEFLILTSTRTGETIGARWAEIDFDLAVWTIPAARMKAGVEHRVPMSASALTLLRRLREISSGEFVFEGARANKPLSNMAILQLLKRMGRSDLTAHGFRSTFRDWAGEQTHHSREVAEAALAHTVRNKTEAAYARGDMFQKRKALMDDWACFLAG